MCFTLHKPTLSCASPTLHLSPQSSPPPGELVHRAHQNLPVECSQLTHALPELMNQAATNYQNVAASTSTVNAVNHYTSNTLLLQDPVHSSNPAVNVVINADVTQNSYPVLSKISSNCDDSLNGRSSYSMTNKENINSVHSLFRQNSSDFFNKPMLPSLEPTNPFSIPTTTSITNAATVNITQTQRRARASLAISALLKLSRGRLHPPVLPPQHSLYLAHLLHALPHAGSNSTVAFAGSSTNRAGSLGDEASVQLQQVYLRKRMVVTPANDMAKMSKVSRTVSLLVTFAVLY